MEPSRGDWIAHHQLDRIEIIVKCPPEGLIQLEATGRSITHRPALWTYREQWGPASGELPVHDAAAHLLLVALQDRPRHLSQLEAGLRGGVNWHEPELPY